MELSHDGWKDIGSPLASIYEESRHSYNLVTPEDLAWIDSCLAQEPDLLDNSWDALKDALLDIISARATSIYEPSSFAAPMLLKSEEPETVEVLYSSKVDLFSPVYDFEEYGDVAEAAVGSTSDQGLEENIFRVWDLNTEFEEEEIVEQLKEALSGSCIMDLPPTSSESITTKGAMEVKDFAATSGEEKLDDLIASMADLSIGPLFNMEPSEVGRLD